MRKPKVSALAACCFALAFVAFLGCPGKQTVEFAAVVPLTGSAGAYGTSIQKGLELAYETLAADTQRTYVLELRIEDSESNPEKARELLDQLYDDDAVAAIGGVTSAEALAMVEVADDWDRVLLSPSASSPQLSGISENFYRIFPTSDAEAVTMAKHATDRLKVEKVVMVTEEGPFGEGAQASFQAVFAGDDDTVVTFPPGTEDFSEIASEALEPKPDAVYVAADGAELAGLLRALRRGGFSGSNDWIMATSALASPEVFAQAGRSAERAFLTQTVLDLESEEEPMRSFVESYTTKYGEAPDFYAAHGYDAMMVMAKALEGAGTTLASEFLKGMRSISSLPGVTGNIQFRESGDVQKFPRIYFIRDGRPQDYDQALKEIAEKIRKRREELDRRRRELMRRQRLEQQ